MFQSIESMACAWPQVSVLPSAEELLEGLSHLRPGLSLRGYPVWVLKNLHGKLPGIGFGRSFSRLGNGFDSQVQTGQTHDLLILLSRTVPPHSTLLELHVPKTWVWTVR